MAVDVVTDPVASKRRVWLATTLVATAGPMIAAILLAPAAGAPPGAALTWLLFVGSSVHVASTGWFATVGEVRAHMRTRPLRYLWTPIVLVVATGTLCMVLDEHRTTWLVLGFFAWQFHHFQKQNLGLVALAARAHGAPALGSVERHALVGAGIGGVLAIVGRPSLLDLTGAPRLECLHLIGVATFCVAVIAGVAASARRPSEDRPLPFLAVGAASLLFFLPAVTLASPYAAVAGLTIAHGLQYLVLMGLLASAPTDGRGAAVGVLVLVNVATLVGFALNRMSHLHGTGVVGRALFGAYLGLVMTHFVVDAGLWRLREQFPRTFLARRLPFLLRA